MERKILSSNIKKTPIEVLDSIQELSDHCFGEDKAFQDNLNKYNAQLFYVLDENKLQGFLATFIAKPDNEYVNKVLDQSPLKEIKNKILPCGFLYVIALVPDTPDKKVRGTGLSDALNNAGEEYFAKNNINKAMVYAWRYNGHATGARPLEKSGYKVIGTAERPWQTKCDSGQLICPHKDQNPKGRCDCQAVIYYKEGLLSR